VSFGPTVSAMASTATGSVGTKSPGTWNETCSQSPANHEPVSDATGTTLDGLRDSRHRSVLTASGACLDDVWRNPNRAQAIIAGYLDNMIARTKAGEF
jgi:hypothetical protein